MRQASIADMAFSWSRLMWPAWARRQAGPLMRKMSATSRAGRNGPARDHAGGGLNPSRSSGLAIPSKVFAATWV